MKNMPLAPEPITSFVGRNEELQIICNFIRYDRNIRLVTLVGLGGVGKTRLAKRVMHEVADEFDADATFADLSPLTDFRLVPATIAQALNITISPEGDIEDQLRERLYEREMLLVLDNFEHVADAARVVHNLVLNCPHVVVLVTSREPLHLDGERVFEVVPFDIPDAVARPAIADLLHNPAVELFVARAQDVRSQFAFTESNAEAVVEICRRLDGLPLAIELAASRVAHLTPEAILRSLDRMLDVLEARNRDRPARHRTLRDAFAWSYSLLHEDERRLFRRLSVFRGGCTLDAISSVCFEPPPEDHGETGEERSHGGEMLGSPIPDPIAALVDRGFLRLGESDDGVTRFMMLETLRQFAFEELSQTHEDESLRWRHATYYLAMAERVRPLLVTSDAGMWLTRMRRELDNFHASLAWSLRNANGAETALRICVALWPTWRQLGSLSQAASWLEEVLRASEDVATSQYADAWILLGHSLVDQERARACYQRALEEYRQIGHRQGEAGALTCLGFSAAAGGRLEDARQYQEQSLTLFDELGEESGAGAAEYQLGRIASELGARKAALQHFDHARERWNRCGDAGGVAHALIEIGRLYGLQGMWTAAIDHLEWSRRCFRSAGNPGGEAAALIELAEVSERRGAANDALALFRQGLEICVSLQAHRAVATAIDGIALVACRASSLDEAVRLWAATSAWRDANGFALAGETLRARLQLQQRARHQMGAARYEENWASGLLLDLSAAARFAKSVDLSSHVPPEMEPPSRVKEPMPALSPREREVLVFVADGMRDKTIALELGISPRTVTTLVTRIFNKLGVDNRTAAAAKALRLGLIGARSEWGHDA